MQKLFTAIAAVSLVVVAAGCGKSDADRQMEQAAAEMQQAAEAATRAGVDAGKGVATSMEEFAKAMAGMTGSDAKTVEPVTFQALQSTLPELPGWEMGKPRGERMTSPMPYSQSEARYTKGGSRIEVTVVDSGFASLLIAPWSMMLASGYSRESSEGYEKAVTVKEQPGFEKWNSESKDGELNILIDRRFLLSIEGDDIEDTGVLRDVADKIDFSRFSSLK